MFSGFSAKKKAELINNCSINILEEDFLIKNLISMFVLAANLMINVLSMIWLEIRNEAEQNL